MPEKAVEAAFGGILEFTLMTLTPSRLAKANSPNSGVPSIVMFFNALQPEKAAAPTFVTLLGITTSCRLSQAKKA
jgi:hypothetical protein